MWMPIKLQGWNGLVQNLISKKFDLSWMSENFRKIEKIIFFHKDANKVHGWDDLGFNHLHTWWIRRLIDIEGQNIPE